MQVYVEYALLENFCMDFALLTAAKAAVKNPARYGRVCAAAALGACFAVAYPLFGIDGLAGGALAIAVKIVAGAAMCALGGKYSTFKGYFKFTAAFLALSFLSGGAMIALFSLAGVKWQSGGGYVLSSVPVGIPLFFVAVLAIAVSKIHKKYGKVKRVTAICTVYSGGASAVCPAFYDSGNKVYSDGAPVSIVPARVAEKLTDTKRIKKFVDIHTVAGKSKIAIFTADKVEIDDGKNKLERRNVTLGVSPRHINKIVLHPDLSEVY